MLGGNRPAFGSLAVVFGRLDLVAKAANNLPVTLCTRTAVLHSDPVIRFPLFASADLASAHFTPAAAVEKQTGALLVSEVFSVVVDPGVHGLHPPLLAGIGVGSNCIAVPHFEIIAVNP